MPTKLTGILILVILLLFSALVHGQNHGNLRQQVVDSVRKSEKEWKLDESTGVNGSVSGMDTVGVDVFYANWEYRNSQMDMLIVMYASSDLAKKDYPTAFQGCADCLYINKTPLATKVPNLGDENRMWEDRSKPLTGIVFRSGKAVVGVSAPSVELATRLAFYIEHQIDPDK